MMVGQIGMVVVEVEKVMRFGVHFKGRTRLDLCFLWELKEESKTISKPLMGWWHLFAEIEKAMVGHLGEDTPKMGRASRGTQEFHFGHVTFEMLIKHTNQVAEWAGR